MNTSETASLIFAAGRGSRMKGYDDNKTLLPLDGGETPFEGSRPILLEILNSLPPGPKALVVHHRKEKVIEATRSYGLNYYEQPLLNGTGGALLAAKDFLSGLTHHHLLITMGDVPLVSRSTYQNLIRALEGSSLVVLGFRTADKKQYGLLEIDGDAVVRSIEWKYWSTFPVDRHKQLEICNSGIYAARTDDLIRYLNILEERPHKVKKEREGKRVEIEEFFITDLVELMHGDGLRVGYIVADDENEVMGVDDLASLLKAQSLFRVHP